MCRTATVVGQEKQIQRRDDTPQSAKRARREVKPCTAHSQVAARPTEPVLAKLVSVSNEKAQVA